MQTVINKKNLGILFGLFAGAIIGIFIVNGQLFYTALLFAPAVLYVCIEKPMIFPFGVYVALLPFDSLLSITGAAQGTTLLKLLGVITILVLLLKGIYDKNFKRPDAAVLWLTLFVAYGIMSYFWALRPDKVFSVIPTFLGLFILYFLTATYKIKKDDYEKLKWFILAGGFLAALVIIVNYSQISQVNDEAMRSTMEMGARHDDPNRFSFSLLIPVACAIQLLLTTKNLKTKSLLTFLLGTILFGIIISGSRGSMLGVCAILITYTIFSKKRSLFIAVLCMIGILLISFIPDFYFQRWSDAMSGGSSGRLEIWEIGINALKKYGLFGAGLNNFPVAYNEFMSTSSTFFSKSSRAPHNIYLGYSVELGVIGFLLMLATAVKHYHSTKSKLKSSNSDGVMLKASFWAILISSLFLDTVMMKSFWLLWMLIMINHNIMKIQERGTALHT